MDDITFCASDCERVNCFRNKANIRDHGRLHSWCTPEMIPDCPLEELKRLVRRMQEDDGERINQVDKRKPRRE